jgi:hypothetical protein
MVGKEIVNFLDFRAMAVSKGRNWAIMAPIFAPAACVDVCACVRVHAHVSVCSSGEGEGG